MRACFVTTSYPRRDGDLAGHFVRSLAVHLNGHGVETTVLAPDDPDVDDPPPPPAVRRVRYAWPRGMQRLCYGDGIPHNLRHRPAAWLNIPGFVAAMAVAICRHAAMADVIHAHWGVLGALAAALRPIHRRPVVLTIHGSDLRSRLGPVRRLTAWAIRHADAVTAVSPELADECRTARPRGPCVWIPNGVEFPDDAEIQRLLAARGRGAVHLVSVGRVIPERRHALLVRALAVVRRQRPAVGLTIVGDGPDLPALRRLVDDLGLTGAVVLPGRVSLREVPAFLARADVYVSPTTVESFGLAVAEAAAYALPIVTTPVGFPPRLVGDGAGGCVVPPDDEAALAAAIAGFCDDADRRRQAGLAARSRAREMGLTWQFAAASIADLYVRLTRGHAKEAR